jgi:hypothetical protein
MRISIHNGKMTMHITLTEVLYFPYLAFMLISLMHCDTT